LADNAYDTLADGELVTRALEGDEFAFERIVARHWEEVWRASYFLARGDRSLAEDVVQTTFLKAFQSLRDYRGDGANRPHDLRPWLLTICRNTVRDGLRKQLRRRDREVALEGEAWSQIGTASMPRGSPSPTDSAEDLMVAKVDLEAALNELDAAEREAFALMHVFGLTSHEAAQVVSVQPSTIRSRLGRARRKLAARLEHNASDD
jgi:RNA polymerase sigma-70 factor (ECF subfamily)